MTATQSDQDKRSGVRWLAEAERNRAYFQGRSPKWWFREYGSTLRGETKHHSCTCRSCFGLGDSRDDALSGFLHLMVAA
jgi:hypothetical protein